MDIDLFLSETKKLSHLECWSVSAGKGAGSHVTLNFGEKYIREKPLKNPNLSDLSRKYDGEYSLFIEESSWRLESDKEVICGSMSPNDNDGIMVKGLNKLLGGKIASVNISYPSLDLELQFQNGLKLILFCNTYAIEEGDNYSFYSPEKIFIVQGLGVLNVQKRRKATRLKSVEK